MSAPPPPDLWPGLTPLRRLEGGARCAVWLATDRAGAEFVLKSTTHSEAALAWLGPVHAAARAAGLLAPALLRAANGELAPSGWSCEPFVPGRPALPADLPALAPRLAAFHAASAALPPRPGLTGTAEGAAFPTDLPADLAQALRAALAPLHGAPRAAIHGDLNPGNLILTTEGPALIDWDEARRDWRFLDTIATRPASQAEARAALAVEILSCWHPEPARARALARRLHT